MKRIFTILFILSVAVAAVTACAPVSGFVQQFVALPDPIQASITGLIVAMVALAFDFAIGRYSWLSWLRKYQQEWALGLAAGFVTWLQNILPTGYEDVSIKGIAFLLSIIFLFVPYLVVRKMLVARGVQGFISTFRVQIDPLSRLTEGRIVHYVMPSGEHRPAIVVRVWRTSDGNVQSNGLVNLTVFPDWSNDVKTDAGMDYVKADLAVLWKTSIVFDVEGKPGTWYWIERA